MTKRIVRDSPVPPPIAPPVLSALAASAAATAVLEVPTAGEAAPPAARSPKRARPLSVSATQRFAAQHFDEHASNRQAELFYLQKQIQQQTQMVFVLEDGSRVQGVVEWYDRHSIKVRGKSRVLIYKSAIKYLYKAGEIGSAPVA
jgi:sRNA-binding regulator protein Hfq